MSIRERLLILVIAVWLPAAAGFALLAWNLHEETAAATLREVEEYGRRVGTTIEREIDERVVIAQTLAASKAARQGDMRQLHEDATKAVEGRNAWVLVVDPERQLLNTRAPYSAQLVNRAKPLPLTSDKPVIVFVPLTPVARTPAVTVFVPIPEARPQAYNVGVSFEPISSLQRILDANPGPFKALTAVVNEENLIMARSRDPEKWFGKSSSPAFVQRIRAGGIGFAESMTLDGVRSMTYLSPPSAYGWSIIVSVPMSELNAASKVASLKAAGAAALLLVFGLIIALLGARKIGMTVSALRRAADELGRNRVPAVLATDVTEVDQISAALRDAGLKAQQANEELEERVEEAVNETKVANANLLQSQKLEVVGRLTAGVAHDFNNLLQTIVTSHYLLSRRITEGLERRSLEGAMRAVSKARDLIQQLMAFGRVSHLAPTAVNIADAVLKSQELTRTAVPESISITTRLEPALPAVHVDPVQFDMALLNLVFNARDAMSSGGTVTITAREAVAGETEYLGTGRFVRFEVADDGAGMTEEVQERAFEPFFSTKPVGSGSGIGLAQVQSFAKQSGGDVLLKSEVGRGTAVWMYLPVSAVPYVEKQQEHGRTTAPRAALEGMRILLVEDDLLVSSATVSALEGAGCVVRHCTTADDAVPLIQDGKSFDVVFTDVVMPGKMDGRALARWCATNRPELSVIVTTGYAENLDGITTTVLRKPYDTVALLNALATAVRRTTSTAQS